MKDTTQQELHLADAELFELVLGDRGPKRSRLPVYAVAGLVALGAHVALLGVAARAEPSLEDWGTQMSSLIHTELSAKQPIVVDKAPPPEPPEPPAPEPVVEAPPEPEPEPPAPEPEPVAKAPPPVKKRIERPAPPAPKPQDEPTPSPSQDEPLPPAAAGQIVAAEPVDSGPVDFTDNTFVTGQANAYVGGASSSGGTNKAPVAKDAVAPAAKPAPNKPSKPSQARSVRLSGNEWRCSWPKAAMAQDIYEQFVVLRVLVRADGTVERATVSNDPGHGFGAAAIACARRTRFSPALNKAGEPIKSMSPPIRVRFTR